MLAQGDPRPPRAGPLGPAYVQSRYLLRGSAWARASSGRGKEREGRERRSQVRSSLEHVFISSFKFTGIAWGATCVNPCS